MYAHKTPEQLETLRTIYEQDHRPPAGGFRMSEQQQAAKGLLEGAAKIAGGMELLELTGHVSRLSDAERELLRKAMNEDESQTPPKMRIGPQRDIDDILRAVESLEGRFGEHKLLLRTPAIRHHLRNIRQSTKALGLIL